MKRYDIEVVRPGQMPSEETRGFQSIADVMAVLHTLQVGDALVINRTDDSDDQVEYGW